MARELLHIYTRVSTRAQEEGSSLEEQAKAGKAYAKKEGLRPKLWSEGGKSANKEDLRGRSVLAELLEQIEAGLVKHLYVWNTDRLSRNTRTWNVIKFKLYDHGVKLHTSGGVVDPTSRQDRLLFGLLQEISAYDNDLRRERSRIGKLNRVRAGGWLGGPPPFGYQLVDKKLALDKAESKWVQKIFKWYADGKSTVFIKGKLDKAGVEPRRKQGTWSLGSIQAMLRNTHPVGFYTYTDKETGETIQVDCPPCVDIETWKTVEKRRSEFQERKGQINSTKHFYLLRDFLFCGHCDTPMGARFRENKNENYYYCPAKERKWKEGEIPKSEKWKRGRVCAMTRSLNRPKTDELVWRQVVDAISKSHHIKEGIKTQVLKSKFADDEEISRKVKAEQKSRKKMDRLRQRAFDAIADVESGNLLGEFEPGVYKRVVKRLQEKKDHIEAELEQSQTREEQLLNQKEWIDWLSAHKDKVQHLEKQTEQERQAYLRGILERIDVSLHDDNRHHLVVHFKMPVVKDRLRYRDAKKKSKGYRIIDGSTELALKGVDLRAKGGRPKKKPKPSGQSRTFRNTPF